MNKIRKYSNTAGSIPAVGTLAKKELALNHPDAYVYFEDTSGEIAGFTVPPEFYEVETRDDRDALVSAGTIQEGDFVRYLYGRKYYIEVYYNGKFYVAQVSDPAFSMVVDMLDVNQPTFKDVIGGKLIIKEQSNNSYVVYSPDPIRQIVFDGYKDEVKYVIIRISNDLVSTKEMFAGCTNLIGGSFQNMDTSLVTDMSSMFKECASIIDGSALMLDTSACTNMNSMFKGCASIEDLNLSEFDTSSVTDMASMFEGCSTIEALDLTSFNMTLVTDTNRMFADCTSLKCITNVDTRVSADKTDMFANTPELVKPDASERSDITDASGANWVNPEGCKRKFAVTYDKLNDTVDVTFQPVAMEYTVDGGSTWTEIGPGTVTLPASSTSLTIRERNVGDITSFNTDYWDALELEGGITLEGGEGLTTLKDAFRNATSITYFDGSKMTAPNLTDVEEMFGDCTNMTWCHIDIDPTNITTFEYMFYDCKALECIDKLNTTGSANKSNMFEKCTALVQPDSASQADLMDSDGADWVNPNSCP